MIKTNFLIFILFTQLSLQVYAQSTTLESDIVYGHLDGMAMTYNIEKPLQPNGLGIIFVVSGGWHSGLENLEITRPFWEVLLNHGYTLFHLYHPSMPTYKVPDAYAAAKAGLTHILANARSYGVDPNQLGITGVSSGGQLALLLALDSDQSPTNEPRLAAVVAFMPPVDLRDSVGNTRASPALAFDPALAPGLSPVDFVSSDDPPVLLVHGAGDTSVPYSENSVRLKALLVLANVPSELLTVDAAHEVFPEPEMSKAHAAMLNWFERYL